MKIKHSEREKRFISSKEKNRIKKLKGKKIGLMEAIKKWEKPKKMKD